MTGNAWRIRQAVRNYLLPMTRQQVERELAISLELGDEKRAEYCREFLTEFAEEWADEQPPMIESLDPADEEDFDES